MGPGASEVLRKPYLPHRPESKKGGGGWGCHIKRTPVKRDQIAAGWKGHVSLLILSC